LSFLILGFILWRPDSLPVNWSSSPAIGITATIPVEIVYAAGMIPLDLNNLFITASNPERLISEAESFGFAHNLCAWIKGIYSVVVSQKIGKVIAVTGGDCSNTVALSEVLTRHGVEVIPFEYPLHRDRKALQTQIETLRSRLSTTWPEIDAIRGKLKRIRGKLKELDRLTFRENIVTGRENHLFLVTSSDFNGDPTRFEKELDHFLHSVKGRTPQRSRIRLGYLGVPPVFDGLYEFIESLQARVVFNEVQRQFSMPYDTGDLIDQYLDYTYPYDLEARVKDIKGAVKERKIDGLIHYTQTFCYRQIYDILLRQSLNIPLLTLEGDRPGRIDGRTACRVETFIEMLQNQE
jgi:benzoyl-CoA reductase/2-hydroxyglutaryl-CoA dehydratase subunit BcrC/BadD/HgdB